MFMARSQRDSGHGRRNSKAKGRVFPDGRLDTDNSARFLDLSSKTLAMMRSAGTGPKFVKRGRVFYFLEDLQAWLAEQPRVNSTAQARLLTRDTSAS
jgi:hypothetical protein